VGHVPDTRHAVATVHDPHTHTRAKVIQTVPCHHRQGLHHLGVGEKGVVGEVRERGGCRE
jgi:hypothetical protein